MLLVLWTSFFSLNMLICALSLLSFSLSLESSRVCPGPAHTRKMSLAGEVCSPPSSFPALFARPLCASPQGDWLLWDPVSEPHSLFPFAQMRWDGREEGISGLRARALLTPERDWLEDAEWRFFKTWPEPGKAESAGFQTSVWNLSAMHCVKKSTSCLDSGGTYLLFI